MNDGIGKDKDKRVQLTLCTFTETLLHSYKETIEAVLIPFQECESDEKAGSEFHGQWVPFQIVPV